MTVVFGALAAPLWQQLKCSPSKVELFQQQADAITLLAIQALISEAEVQRARRRLVKAIGEAHEHFCSSCYAHKTKGRESGWWDCTVKKCTKVETAPCRKHLSSSKR